jgi:hypothetical protein
MSETIKTYKREVAVILLLWLAYIVEFHDAAILQIVIWPIFGFATAAFGLDAVAKQLQRPAS